MSMNLEGCLRNHKKRKINFIEDDNGRTLSDSEARLLIADLLAKGHRLMDCSGGRCEGFDPLGRGCPGHPVSEEFKCDGCGKDVSSPRHPFYDENFNLQEGLSACDNCNNPTT